MKREKSPLFRKVGLSFLLALCLIGAAWFVFGRISDQADGTQTALVKEAVRRALVTCYAVEGYYPLEVETLTDGYGLKYDEDRYMVVLDGFASNIMPTIRIIRKGADAV